LTLFATGVWGIHLVGQLRATGVATNALSAALAFAALAFGLGAAAIVKIGRADPGDLGFLGARYVRIVFSVKLIVFVTVLFGSQREATSRVAAYVLGVMALHRLVLLSPARLSRTLAAIGRWPALRVAELLLFNLCVTAVVVEATLRIYYLGSGQGFFAPQHEHPFERKVTAPLFGFAPNSLGYNDDEFVAEKRADVQRVAAIGDSYFLAQVPRPHGVIARTEALLVASGVPIEVYNFGIYMSNLDDYRIVLEEEALRYDPDLVLLGIFVGNDVRISTLDDSWTYHSYATSRAISAIRQRIAARLLLESGAFRDVTTERNPDLKTPIAKRERYLASIRRDLPLFRPRPPRKVARAWFDSLATLEQITAICRERGVPLAVVLAPSHPQVSRAILEEGARSAGVDPAALDVSIPQRRLVAFFAERGVPLLDLLPAFARAAEDTDPDDFYLKNDTHWSVSGNELAAQEIARFVADQLR
jgi:hypothetical protein